MNKAIEVASNTSLWLLTALQTEQTLKIVQLCLAIIATVISIVFSILNWYKKSVKDGKITKEEIKEGVDIISDGVNQVTEQVKVIQEEIKKNKEAK